jgi:hypothetical protein
VVITSYEHLRAAVAGQAGTRIVPHGETIYSSLPFHLELPVGGR